MYHLLSQYIQDKASINEATLEQCLSLFKARRTKRGEILLRPGDICRHYYFVNKGCLRLFAVNDKGEEATRYFAFEGSFGTALPSLITGEPAFEFIQTIEASELLMIDRENFYTLVENVPAFGLIYRMILEAAFITAQKRIYSFQGEDALQKLRWVMDYQPFLLTRVSNKLAASFLGMTPSTLSRLKQKI